MSATTSPASEGSGELQANDDVGMCLMLGEETDAIIEILKDELGSALRVTDNMSYLKIETTGQIEVAFSDVAEVLGRPFGLSEFQMIFSSYYGRPAVTDTGIGVYSSMSAGVSDSLDSE